jgi:hypothetical protein
MVRSFAARAQVYAAVDDRTAARRWIVGATAALGLDPAHRRRRRLGRRKSFRRARSPLDIVRPAACAAEEARLRFPEETVAKFIKKTSRLYEQKCRAASDATVLEMYVIRRAQRTMNSALLPRVIVRFCKL